MAYRCHDCAGEPVFCADCCKIWHGHLPFHRISVWQGTTFIRTALSEVGVTVNLGHDGALCPKYNENGKGPVPDPSSLPEDPDIEDNSDEERDKYEAAGIQRRLFTLPKGLDEHGCRWIVVVDITGVHILPSRHCACLAGMHEPLYKQFLRMGLYPATHERIQTVFTFRLLDDYHLNNLEDKASAQRYYSKLKRLTSNAFPHLVPDRYRDLMRVAREWRNLEARKRAGVLSESQEIPEGGLALFCPACPQPGVNLPENWHDDPEQWVFYPVVPNRKLTHVSHQMEIHANVAR